MSETDPGQVSPVAFLIVKSMLLTGFDAPVEQVLYLDRSIKEAELLQAIARVNRTASGKNVGYVVDYYGVGEHLKQALAAYSSDDLEGLLQSIADELPKLADRRQRVRNLFLERGVDRFDTEDDVEACVIALEDERLRAAFEVALKQFLTTLDIVMPRPESLPFNRDAKFFGMVQVTGAPPVPGGRHVRRLALRREGPQPDRRPRARARGRPEDSAGFDHRSGLPLQGWRPSHRSGQGIRDGTRGPIPHPQALR